MNPTELLDSRTIEIDNMCGSDTVYTILSDIDSTLAHLYNNLLDMRITDANNPYINSMIEQLENTRKKYSQDNKRSA